MSSFVTQNFVYIGIPSFKRHSLCLLVPGLFFVAWCPLIDDSNDASMPTHEEDVMETSGKLGHQ